MTASAGTWSSTRSPFGAAGWVFVEADLPMFYAHSGSVASRNGHSGMIRPTPRQEHPQAGISVKLLSADGSASGPVEKLSGMQHTVHDDG